MLGLRPILGSLFGISLPPTVALFLTFGFIIFLFRRDVRQRTNLSGALWLPLLWMLISLSRHVSEWLAIMGLPLTGGVVVEEGSPFDAFCYFALIAAGAYVLSKRQVFNGKLFERNGWLMAFLLFCFLAIVWSDFPFVAFKRWIKILGNPIMALIVLTEPDFKEGLLRLMKRIGFVFLPLSICFIKYFPEIGRKYDEFTGLPLNSGAAGGKNMLGCACMLLGFFFCWRLLQVWKSERGRARRNELILTAGLLLMILYLFKLAHSATSMVCLAVGGMVVVALGMRSINKRYIGIYLIAVIISLAIAQFTFSISTYLLEILQRDATLTTRTEVWADLLKMKINPVVGVGFESFWLGDRLTQMHVGRSWQPNEAHNGYLETYINLGLVGLFMLGALLIATFRKIRVQLLDDFEWGRFRLGLFLIIVLYNLTEVSFRGPHPLWVMFYIIAFDYVNPWQGEAGIGETTEGEEEEELAYV